MIDGMRILLEKKIDQPYALSHWQAERINEARSPLADWSPASKVNRSDYIPPAPSVDAATVIEQARVHVSHANYVLDTAKGRHYIDARNRKVDKAHQAVRDASYALYQLQGEDPSSYVGSMGEVS